MKEDQIPKTEPASKEGGALRGGNWVTKRKLHRSLKGDLAHRVETKTLFIRVSIVTTLLFLLVSVLSILLYVQLLDAERNHNAEIDEANKQNALLSADVEGLTRELTDLRAERDRLAGNLEATLIELKAVKAERDELLNNDAVISSLKAQVTELEAQIAKKDAEIAALTEKLNQKVEMPIGSLAEKMSAVETLLASGAPMQTVSVKKYDKYGVVYYEDEPVYPNLSVYLYDERTGISYAWESGKTYEIGELKYFLYGLALLQAADREQAGLQGGAAQSLVYDLDAVYTLKASDIVPGSGIIKNDKPGTQYTYLRLAEIMLSYCDGTAYHLLYQRYGEEPLRLFLASLPELTSNEIESKLSARDWMLILRRANAMMRENGTYAEQIKSALTGAVATIHSQTVGGSVARQYSRTETGHHELGIQMSGDGLIVVMMSDVSEMDARWSSYLTKLYRAMDDMMAVFRVNRK